MSPRRAPPPALRNAPEGEPLALAFEPVSTIPGPHWCSLCYGRDFTSGAVVRRLDGEGTYNVLWIWVRGGVVCNGCADAIREGRSS